MRRLHRHFRVDPQADTDGAAGGPGESLDEFQLGKRFDVEQLHVRRDALLDLAGSLAHTAEDDVARGESGVHRAEQLATTDDINPAALGTQHAEQRAR